MSVAAILAAPDAAPLPPALLRALWLLVDHGPFTRSEDGRLWGAAVEHDGNRGVLAIDDAGKTDLGARGLLTETVIDGRRAVSATAAGKRLAA